MNHKEVLAKAVATENKSIWLLQANAPFEPKRGIWHDILHGYFSSQQDAEIRARALNRANSEALGGLVVRWIPVEILAAEK